VDPESIDTLIEQLPIFHGLPPQYLKTIAACASNVRFDEGQKLFAEGDEANRFFVLRHGLVAIEMFVPHRGTVTIQTVRDHDVVGWSWLFPPYQWHFDARAVESTRAVAFDARCLRSKCDDDSAIGYELIKRFAEVMMQRIQATRVQLMDVYGHAGA